MGADSIGAAAGPAGLAMGGLSMFQGMQQNKAVADSASSQITSARRANLDQRARRAEAATQMRGQMDVVRAATGGGSVNIGEATSQMAGDAGVDLSILDRQRRMQVQSIMNQADSQMVSPYMQALGSGLSTFGQMKSLELTQRQIEETRKMENGS